jgi:hypothetical protein
MFMCVVNLKAVNKLDLTWKQSFLIKCYKLFEVRLASLNLHFPSSSRLSQGTLTKGERSVQFTSSLS